MYDELMADGSGREDTSEDDRVVRNLYQTEVLESRAAAMVAERVKRLAPAPLPQSRNTGQLKRNLQRSPVRMTTSPPRRSPRFPRLSWTPR